MVHTLVDVDGNVVKYHAAKIRFRQRLGAQRAEDRQEDEQIAGAGSAVAREVAEALAGASVVAEKYEQIGRVDDAVVVEITGARTGVRVQSGRAGRNHGSSRVVVNEVVEGGPAIARTFQHRIEPGIEVIVGDLLLLGAGNGYARRSEKLAGVAVEVGVVEVTMCPSNDVDPVFAIASQCVVDRYVVFVWRCYAV